ncbi:hypothetical protein [Lentzea pudingi]|nr:hypothetical protein [Lentzea pudingi]
MAVLERRLVAVLGRIGENTGAGRRSASSSRTRIAGLADDTR